MGDGHVDNEVLEQSRMISEAAEIMCCGEPDEMLDQISSVIAACPAGLRKLVAMTASAIDVWNNRHEIIRQYAVEHETPVADLAEGQKRLAILNYILAREAGK